MKYNYLTIVSLNEAVDKYRRELNDIGVSYKTETVPTQDSLGRTTAKAVYARICSPHYNSCAMDGIAVKAEITFGASSTSPVTLSPEDYIRVDTGDPLPKGYDSVVMIEDVVETETEEVIRLYSPAVPWQHVRQIGEDISAGDMILPSFTVITPAHMGAFLAGGVLEVEVVKRPVVGIIPTGDEIVSPCADPKEGDIIEFNSTIFSGMLANWGAVPKVYPIVKDKMEDISAALRKAVSECDAVLLNAGSSAGRDDYSSTVIEKAGKVYYHGIAIKPGKPAILGEVEGKPVVGLPGYPVSSIIVLETVFKPILEMILGRAIPKGREINAVISKKLTSSLKYEEFVRARLGSVGGRLVAVPLANGAGVVTSFTKADGIIHIPQDCEGYDSGEKVSVELLRPLPEIEGMLVITGSHDPLIDEAIDLLKGVSSSFNVASSHVGSMGGIMAVKRREAHMAGIHLLDEESGIYNDAYIKTHFPNGGVTLVECVQRVQGYMVAKGNPLNISGWKDIISKNLNYVNRQKGAGTRILCDFLLKKEKISPSEVNGYDRVEFTHTGVAAVIASGSGDVGLGILSAAKIYGLDFIPVCNEQYDLLISNDAMDLDFVKRFLEILRSEAFRKRLDALGGYTLDHPGEIRKRY